MERPMRDMLERVSGRVSLHMPGCQGRGPFGPVDPYRLDATELPVTDDLYRPTGAIARAQELAAISAGAASTLLLHGGSTAGVHAMLLYAAGRGGQVILPRNAHLSCLNVCALADIEPVFAEPDFTPSGRPYTTPAAYARALDEHPGAKAALALHTDYYGLLSDLPGIAREVHRRGALLLCDEAHGAYFNWRQDVPNAGRCGADLFVQSAHKTLPALTPGAWLHAMPGVDAERLRAMLRMVQTSSPSFVNMLSLDDARAWMDERGAAACDVLGKALEAFRVRAAALGYADGQRDGMPYDRLRLVLNASMGGDALADALEKQGVDVEMSDRASIVCILSLMDGEERLRRLLDALRKLDVRGAPEGALPLCPAEWPIRKISLSRAAFAPQEEAPLSDAAGRVSAAAVGPYPPGTAWLTPGDEITPEIANLLACAPPERFFGLTRGGCIRCVKTEGIR
ncbi:MAG: DegT/DnrJ/EryC1/StrS family aminotransferase [Eubacteriales bacterium]|nr:DegT/DnrJ/EryC1/StrS family aminotransferase [Eubacteriales bacterium]